jgi:LuxR family maltose regulon positive regulatory protein
MLVESISTALAGGGRPRRGICWMPRRSRPCADLPLATRRARDPDRLARARRGRRRIPRRLTEALELAAEHGIVSAFVWAGPEVIKLVEAIPLRSTPFRAEVLDCAT